jgi:hypothetical protein
MKWLAYAAAGILLIALAIVAVGFLLPEQHTAAVRAHYRQPPDSLRHALTTIEEFTAWRTGLDSVQLLERAPPRWREFASWGQLTMVLEESSPARVVSRIDDPAADFGGTWTWDIAPDASGSVVTITERGEVYNPLFRFMSRFVFGHYTGLETYARDLGRHFGEDVQPERVAE